MAIVATPTRTTLDVAGEIVQALDWATVHDIVDTFNGLNPYDRDVISGSILKIETDNYDPDGHQRELRCYAISAKRYQLTTTTGDNVKASAHGLGHLINPHAHTGDNTDWIIDAWRWLRHPDTEPDWLDLPALSRITITSSDALRWFEPINANLDYRDRIKPHNFLLIAHPDPLDNGSEQPVTPHRNDLTNWHAWTWTDRNTGHPATVHTHPNDGQQRPGTRILTYRDILTRYHQHPETKSLDRHHQPCRGNTHGLLRRRPVHAIEPITYIGKESHDLHRRSVGLTQPDDTQTYTAQRDPTWTPQVIAALATIPTTTIAHDTGVNIRTVQRAKTAQRTPHAHDRALLHAYAVTHARTHTGARPTQSPDSVLYQFVTTRNDESRRNSDTQ